MAARYSTRRAGKVDPSFYLYQAGCNEAVVRAPSVQMSATLPEHLAALMQPRAYPHPVSGVTLVETHVSWILLTGEVAYKIKRPVCFPFLDLRSLERRAFFCNEELRLNRRFAPQLYREVCPIVRVAGEARLDGEGEPIEYAVRMRQFPRENELDNLLAHGRIAAQELADFGADLAAIHSALPVAEPPAPWGDPQAIRDAISNNFEECVQASAVFDGASAVRILRARLDQFLQAATPWMFDRREDGRVRECHGDLHAANIVRLESKLVPFDCLEFAASFRWIDVADEIAFLLADLDARGFPRHEQAFLGGYLGHSGDYQACRLLPLYKAHRALIRAKVNALRQRSAVESGAGVASADDGNLQAYRAYLDCAGRALSRKAPLLVLISGLSGSGKTWLAERLAPGLGAVHLRSDIERKRLAGLDEGARTGSALGEGVYCEGFTARVYAHLVTAAHDILCGGYIAVVDATFSRREVRDAFRKLAFRLNVPACLIHCHASHEVLRSRIVERERQGRDASEADLTVLEWQQEHWEPIAAQEHWTVIAVTTADVDLAELEQHIRSLPV